MAQNGGSASSSKAQAKKRELSRLDEEMYIKDTRYACSYWFEHRDNYKCMLLQLLSEESLLRMLENARSLILAHNANTGCIPREYNDTVVSSAYRRFERIVREQCSPEYTSPTPEKGYAPLPVLYSVKGGCKLLLWDAMDGFFEVLDGGKLTAGTSFAELFAKSDAMDAFTRAVLPVDHDVEARNSYFLPQLLFYILRLLNFYDNALEGYTVTSFLRGQAQKQEDKYSEHAVSKAWASLENVPVDDDSDVEDAFTECEVTDERGQKEMELLTTAVKRARGEFEEMWIQCNEAFRRQWSGVDARGSHLKGEHPGQYMDVLSRRGCLLRARNIVIGIASGNYKTAMLYCPELAPSKLAKLEHERQTLLDQTFIQLAERVFKNASDPFLRHIHDQLCKTGKGDAFPLIRVSRTLILTVFCFLVVAEVLRIGFDRILRCVPGYKAGEVKETHGVQMPSEEHPAESVPTDAKVPPSSRAERVAPPTAETSVWGRGPLPNGRRWCTFFRCPRSEKEGEKFQVCAGCRKHGIQIPYCSAECQKRDWKVSHKSVCRAKLGAPQQAKDAHSGPSGITVETEATPAVEKASEQSACEKAPAQSASGGVDVETTEQLGQSQEEAPLQDCGASSHVNDA